MVFGGGQSLGSATGEIIISAAGVRRGVEDAKREFRSGLNEIGSQVSEFGSNMTNIGGSLTLLTGPLVAGFVAGANAAVGFEESLSNIQSVTGDTAEETAALGETLQTIGENSRYGAQAISEAYYDVAGGVADASVRMDVLNAAVATAQAGNADLGATTQALIAVMNSYSFSADQAGFASDVLTRTVGMGVGTMGDFAGALPQVTGLANSMGISFEDVASATAFLTTRGNTASQATTQLGAMMSSLLNPSARMTEALRAMGFQSGQAAVEQLGLVGTYQALVAQFGTDAIGPMVGSIEALRGITALTGDEFTEFSDTFVEGIDGATAAAEDVQMQSPAAQFALLQSQLGSLAIEVGQALIPALMDMWQSIQPVLLSVIDWIRQNPELVSQIAQIVMAVAAFGAALVAGGPIISAIGTIIGLLASPIGIIAALVGALAVAFTTNFMGIRDAVQPVIDQLAAGFQGFINIVASIWASVQPALIAFGTWITTDGLPLIGSFISDTIVPIIENLIATLIRVWNDVSPFLFSLFDWFITTGLPIISSFINDVIVPIVQFFIDKLSELWTTVSPFLSQLYDWFITTGLPLIQTNLESFGTFVQGIIDLMAGIWTAVEPALSSLFDWFINSLGWVADNVITPLTNAFSGLLSTASNVMSGIGGFASGVGDFVSGAAQSVSNFFGGSRDSGGPVTAGVPYYVGRGAQPELFIPETNGSMIPANQQNNYNSGSSTTINGLTINANSYAEGQAAAAGFHDALEAERRRRG